MKKAIVALLLYSILSSQTFTFGNDFINYKRSEPNRTSEFIFESYPNQELIPIRLLGAVKNSGLYYLPSNTKLTTLLTLAGGTTNEADLSKIVIGNNKFSLEHSDENETRTFNLDRNLNSKKIVDYTLRADDIVYVRNKEQFIGNETFRTLSFVSVILTSLLTAIVIKDKSK